MLLSTNVALEWLQIDPDLLRTEHCWRAFWGTNIDDLERPWTQKIGVYSEFLCYFRLRQTPVVHFRSNILQIDQDNLRTKLSYIKLMLWRVSW